MNIKERVLKNLDLIQKYILYLLYSNNQEPIKGKLWLQKEVFLITKNISELEKESDFAAHIKGPYSEEVEEALTQLQLVDAVKIQGKYDGKIILSELGMELAKQIHKELPEEVKKIINDMKVFLNDMNEDELLAYIYFSFSEMTKESVKFEQVKKIRLDAAIKLFSRNKLSLGKASQVSGLNKEDFIKELKKRRITVYEE